ncbi:MAG: phytoene desaturase family protein, partial [Chitinophagaceae bacterium]
MAQNNKTALVIGTGFSALSAASFLARDGWKVTVLEQHAIPGGRARKMEVDGFTFDMGPSWYWMPDVFERYFQQFGKKVSDYYQLVRLDPSYRVYFPNDAMDVPADYNQLKQLFERIEPGSGAALDRFMDEAAYKYQVGMNKLVFKPGQSLMEFADAELVRGVFRLDVFQSISKHVKRHFKNPKLIELMEFPVLFLGALPQNTPALYSLMNYADVQLGTWYPIGGMYKIVEAMHRLAVELGVTFLFNHKVSHIEVKDGRAVSVTAGGNNFTADIIISGADYHHTETALLPAHARSYSDQYWNTRVMAPSSLLYYVGLNKRLHDVPHHTLFFDTDFSIH